MNEQGKIVFIEKKKTKWHWAGEIVLFTACVVSSTAGALAILSDRDTNANVADMERKFEMLEKKVREEGDFTRATESALNKNVANLAGQWSGSGEKESAIILTNFIETTRQEVRAEIKKRNGAKL